tara:strand:+ start:687 stop:1334 length:648 start_codon:yes stop_codon:yes gene_type:complete
MNIAIIDYNSGNLASLQNSLESAVKNNKQTFNVNVTAVPEEVIKADKVILPGVGDFLNCKNELLKIDGMVDAINYFIKDKEKPFLGICIGMQLMANVSYERKKNKGLEFIDSEVIIIDSGSKEIRVPHMGWNNVSLENKSKEKEFPSLNDNDFYFVHSYHMKCKDKNEVLASTIYGKKIVSAVIKDNLLGVQFHPEKSQEKGKKFLKEFLDWKPE